MKKIIRFTLFSVVLLITIFGILSIVLYSGMFGILSPFNITDVNNTIGTEYKIKFDKVKAAKYYELIITDAKDNEVFNVHTTKNINTYNFESIEANTNYKVTVIAHNKKGKTREANNTYSFTHSLTPMFGNDTNPILGDEGMLVYIEGDLSSKKYTLKVTKSLINEAGEETNTKVLYNKIFTKDAYELKADKYTGSPCKITMSLFKGETLVDEVILFYQLNPLKEPRVLNSGEELDYTDVALFIEEDRAASEYEIAILKDNGDILEKTTSYSNEVLISRNKFSPGSTNTLRITARCGEYERSYDYTFTMDMHALAPVYMSKDPENFVKGDKVELFSNSNGTIVYTIDGTNPISGGLVYQEPITITEDTTISAYVKDGNNISKVTKYDIKVDDRDKVIVYLSPSNQVKNIGVDPYTNEREELNKIADIIESKLKEKKVTVIRQQYLYGDKEALDIALKQKASFVINLQTDSSYGHDKYGISTYTYDLDESISALASLIHKNISSIYTGDRNQGVKATYGVKKSYVSKDIPSMTINLGYHDSDTDAKWIIDNKDKIGETIASSILSYYGL